MVKWIEMSGSLLCYFLVFICSIFLAPPLYSQKPNADVRIEINPKVSQGQPVYVTFSFPAPESFSIIDAPESTADWRIKGPELQKSYSAKLVNGKMTQSSTQSIIFEFNPQKTGPLLIHPIKIKIGETLYASPSTTINVQAVTQRQRPQRPNFHMNPLDEESFAEAIPNIPPSLNSPNRKLEVFIAAEPSKTEVYIGELIVLPFYVYASENIFRNLEFASFPVFKDFLKEELFLPKTWRSERVEYRNSSYLRAEIIRFALFPLKEGELIIDPLKMRFEIDTSIYSFFENLMGQPLDKMKDNNFVRSSGSVPIKVKALPPPINQSIATADVPIGQYSIKMDAPKKTVNQNEAFALKFKVEGRGNIKGIPEPLFELPKSLQKSRVATDYSFNEASEGYKEFDVLIVPREAGEIVLPENKWTYFDPDKHTYEQVLIPQSFLQVRPNDRLGPQASKDNPMNIFIGQQNFVRERKAAIPPSLWSIPLCLYAFASFIFFRRRKEEDEASFLKIYPWIQIERQIQLLDDIKSLEGLRLLEAWILCRFKDLRLEHPSFYDLCAYFKEKCPVNTHLKIDKLSLIFKEIESIRFGKRNFSNTKDAGPITFEIIKKLSEEIHQSSKSYSPSAETSLDDED